MMYGIHDNARELLAPTTTLQGRSGIRNQNDIVESPAIINLKTSGFQNVLIGINVQSVICCSPPLRIAGTYRISVC
jgi:hypothetical protein